MNIILDNRENSLIKLFNDYNHESISINVSQLPLGDVLINQNDNNLILIERKTYADLLASIKDSRFSEQSYRLSNTSNLNTHSIIYLIEGNINDYPENEKKIIYSAIISLYYYKGFSVFRTYNITETFDYIRNLSEKILRESLKNTPTYLSIKQPEVIDISGNNLNSLNYCSVVKKVKKDNVVKENIGEIMLSQIPGVSATSAIAILKNFDSFSQFIIKIKENNNLLDDITTESNGKKRKLSKNTIKKIIEFLT